METKTEEQSGNSSHIGTKRIVIWARTCSNLSNPKPLTSHRKNIDTSFLQRMIIKYFLSI